MEYKSVREYKIKFYLNASHYILSNGKKGQVHPHTWEFVLRIALSSTDFVEFRQFERGINDYLSRYQNKLLNEIHPFTDALPILENIVDIFARDFYKIIRDAGGRLTEIEGSESPTHSYILLLDWQRDETREETISTLADSVLDNMLHHDKH